MVWNMNFCAPFLPNDPTINLHRKFQGFLLVLFSLLYVGYHVYYKFFGPPPISEEQQISEQAEQKEGSQNQSQNDSAQNKEVSIKLEEMPNMSSVKLKTGNLNWQDNKKTVKGVQYIKQNVNLQEIQNYFPLVYGHFAVAAGMSVMYTPYAQQSIAFLLYISLCGVLIYLNSKRHSKSTTFVWILMALLLLFVFNTTLLEVGQSNWDKVNATCFAKMYVPLY